MANLCDFIEVHLKALLESTADGTVELQRSELAEQFGCAPSQINYVLSTRFTLSRGYTIESRRGGGGYIRLTRLQIQGYPALQRILRDQLGDRVTQDEAIGFIDWLAADKLITQREKGLMQSVLVREAIALDLPIRDYVRANLLRSMLVALMRFKEG